MVSAQFKLLIVNILNYSLHKTQHSCSDLQRNIRALKLALASAIYVSMFARWISITCLFFRRTAESIRDELKSATFAVNLYACLPVYISCFSLKIGPVDYRIITGLWDVNRTYEGKRLVYSQQQMIAVDWCFDTGCHASDAAADATADFIIFHQLLLTTCRASRDLCYREVHNPISIEMKCHFRLYSAVKHSAGNTAVYIPVYHLHKRKRKLILRQQYAST
jgi:hypothetical protein